MGSKLKIFEDLKVRSYLGPEEEEWYFSAVDVCYVLAESASKDPGAYWRKLKQRLKKEGSEVVTNCHGLKLMASVYSQLFGNLQQPAEKLGNGLEGQNNDLICQTR